MLSTLVFLGSTPDNASQLYTLSSTPGAAVQTSLTGYPESDAGPDDITAFGGGAVFSGGAAGAQNLWVINAAGVASQVTDDLLSPDLAPSNIAVADGTLFFSGLDASGNTNLYVSDGTTGGTREIVAGNTGSSGLVPDEIVTANGRAFFSGIDAGGGTDLWVSDGTMAGTQALNVANVDTQNIAEMGIGLNPTNITVANKQIFFAGTDANGSIGLWKSDGTAAGTTELAPSSAATGGVAPTSSNIVAFNGLTYFAGHDAAGNIGLWSTDGTSADTVKLSIANSSANGLGPVSLTVMNGSLYFGGTDASGNTGLWKSDGTAAGTMELQVAGTASGGLAPVALNASDYANVPMTVFNNQLYFAGNGADGTSDLWTSDGTAAGTVQVSTPAAAGTTTGVLPTDFAVLGGTSITGNTSVVASAIAPLTIGSGHDSLTFVASEDAYQGDAQYTISVDGKQIGGVQTETAQRASSQAQTITVNGDFGNGMHLVSLAFLNDAYGGSVTAARNLYANSFSYDGASSTGGLSLLKTGTQTITVGTATPGITTLGSGSDSITLQMSEDAFLGNAQFTVSVDGTQIGGVQTVTASHSAGQSQQFNMLGNFGSASHTVSVSFVNDAAGPTTVQDRNLYVNSTSFNGTLVAQGALAEFSGGTQNVVTGVAAAPVQQYLQIGNNGPDSIVLRMSEDAFVGDAQFTVAVDNTQVGGVVTAQDSHSAGLDQSLLVVGSFGPGQHQVTVTFLNDLSGPNVATQDRNLYVDGASFDGVPTPGATLALLTGGPQTLTVGTPINTGTISIGSGFDTLALKVSEDFYQGNAQYIVTIDGQQVGGVQTATALHGSGQDTTLDVLGNFGAGQHTVSVSFLNDAYAGSPTTDRNLYIDGASYNNASPTNAVLALMGMGSQSLVVGTAQQATVSLGSGSDTVSLYISEDYFQGDAQFTLAVDGKQIGGVQTASALRSTGRDTIYNLLGSFGAGQHSVVVDFLNDDSGPNITTQDRNLYVDGASYDGMTIPSASLGLYAAGTQTTTVGSAGQGTVNLGSGMDTVSLQVSEDFYQGDAQFTVSVDGIQIGGIQTTGAQHGAKQDQTFNLLGNFGSGQHKVAVNFLDDAYGGSAATDRNLYVDGASYDGVATSGTLLALMTSGVQSTAVGNPDPAVVTIGNGTDTIGLKISEDFYAGDAQFTISVDGHQIGGTQIAGAQHAAGQDQTFNVLGNFGSASHVVTVDFLNDAYGNGLDRNVYIDATSFNGKTVANGSGGVPSAVPGSVSIAGSDTLTLKVSEDAYLGDARFTVSVDGKQVGGTITATASHAAGQSQTVSLAGSWGLGTHTVGVTFLNDAYGSNASQDRNLYIGSAGIDGASTPENIEQGSNGTASFVLVTATTYSPGTSGGAINTLGNDTVSAGTGAVEISANGPSVSVTGGSGQMTFFGGTGTNTVVGGTGTSNLQDSGGSLSFTAGTGATTISAGSSHELYTIINGQAGSSLDLYGFTSTSDKIHLQGYSGNGIISQQVAGGSTQIILNDNTKIVLHGVTQISNQQVFI